MLAYTNKMANFETVKLKDLIRPFSNIWQFIGVMMLVSTIFLNFFWPSAFDSLRAYLVGLTWGTSIWVTQSIGNSYVFHVLNAKFPWHQGMVKRGIITIFAVGLYSATAYMVVQILMFAIFVPDYTLKEAVQNTLHGVPLALTIAFSISFIFTFFGFAKALIRAEVEKERLQTEMMTYKYEALRNHINPHFLFNSFNVLSELVYENQDLAVRFIQQLSDLYRYVLDAKDKELVLLQEELDFIRSYVFLLKTRFENRVAFTIDISANDNEYIVPMAIQLLIENCIKHNEATTKKPLTITVKRDGEFIRIANNLQPKKFAENSTKTGLSNLKERYTYFESHPIRVSVTNTEYIVCIPILKMTDKA